MSVNFKALGGLLTFRYINEVEDLDLDDLQDIYNDLEEEHNKLKGEMGRLKDAIDKKNPEERKESPRLSLGGLSNRSASGAAPSYTPGPALP